MRDTRVLLLMGLLGVTGCAATGPRVGDAKDQPLAEFAWLAGSWVEVEGEMRMEEHWTLPSGGVMLGTSRTLNQDRLAYFEYMRIEDTPAGVVYVAHPRGGNPTSFPLIEAPTADSYRAVFENLNHDHPQRIIYERLGGDALYIKIEGEPEGVPTEEDWLMGRFKDGQCAWVYSHDGDLEFWEPVRALADRAYSAARVAVIAYRFQAGVSCYLADELRSAVCSWLFRVGCEHTEDAVQRVRGREPDDQSVLVSAR